MTRHLYIITMILLLLGACRHDEILLHRPNENVRSLGGHIRNSFSFTLFTAALEHTGLMDTLEYGAGPYTVLAVEDEAFINMGMRNTSDIYRLNRDSLRQVMAYHILPQRLMQEDIPLNEINLHYPTLSGNDVETFRCIWEGTESVWNGSDYEYNTRKGNLITFSGVEVKKTDYTAMYSDNYADKELSNGVMHTLRTLIKPIHGKTVQDWLESNPDFSIFVAGLKKFGIWDDLSGIGPYTVFVPANDIFEDFDITLDSIARMDATKYNGALLFGSYIMNGKRHFISDYYFYYLTQNQLFSMDNISGAPGYNRFFMGTGTFVAYNSIHGAFYYDRTVVPGTMVYSLGISTGENPWGFRMENSQDAFLGDNKRFDHDDYRYLWHLPMGVNLYQTDYILQNGIAHRFHSLTVLPEEALID